MGATQVTTALLIARKRAEITVAMREHLEHKHECDRGTYSARLAREKLHKEFDRLYEELRLLELRADIEALDEPA
jgi:hypothetical protein